MTRRAVLKLFGLGVVAVVTGLPSLSQAASPPHETPDTSYPLPLDEYASEYDVCKMVPSPDITQAYFDQVLLERAQPAAFYSRWQARP